MSMLSMTTTVVSLGRTSMANTRRKQGGRRTAVVAATVFVLLQASSLAVHAQSPSSQSVARAARFIETSQRGKFVLGYLHYGSNYGGHTYVETRGISSNGRPRPGHFALVYKFIWDGDGYTNLAFLCNEDGDVYGVQALDHNADFNQPFLKANLVIQILGNAMVELFKEKMTADDRATVQQLINRADAEGMLELGLRLQQTLGR